MAATFPLSAGTYSINGRKYRKTAYNLKADTSFDLNTDTTFADTPDIYEDEASADCFAPRSFLEYNFRKLTWCQNVPCRFDLRELREFLRD